MNRTKLFIFLLVCSLFNAFAQQKVAKNTINNGFLANQLPEVTSNIQNSTLNDSVFLKLQLKNAHYDFRKNNLPYYIVSKNTNYKQNANPTLIIKKTLLVGEPNLTVIKKYLQTFLTSNFELVAENSLSNNENLNHYKLIPFRLNSQNQIEELIDYEINWTITNSNNRTLSSASSFSNNSVLASGTWYKIGLTKTGVYKIDKDFLKSMGIDVSTLNPKNIRIYGNGGKMTPERNGDFRYDDLQENAIQVVGETDGVFDNGDYILFYATGSTNWNKTNSSQGVKFKHEKNLYTDSSFYFMTTDLGLGERITTSNSLPNTPNVTTNSYDFYAFHEEDNLNFIKSGRELFGEYFDVNPTYIFSWADGDFVTNDTISCAVRLAGRSLGNVNFLTSGNGINLSTVTNGFNINDYLGKYTDIQFSSTKVLNTNPNGINISITKQTNDAVGWLDYLIVNARRNIVINTKQFQFRDTRISGLGNICNYSISNPQNASVFIWNVSDPIHPYNQSFVTSGSTLSFTANADSLNEYAIAMSSDYYKPQFVGKVANQNLHAIQQADYVIIAHPLFMQHAQRLANLHQQQEGFTYAIASTDLIYNEFGSGKPEASAIRDFVRMLYSRNIASGKQVRYLALLGDGSYYNRNRSLSNNTNLIPTYQSFESNQLLYSTSSDDFYGLMDPNEGYDALAEQGVGGVMDIGVGRLIGHSTTEMNAIINKIENYYKKETNFSISDANPSNCNQTSESVLGDWRNWLVFAADDEDNSLHTSDADELAEIVRATNQNYNIDKIYLDSYQQYSTPGGQRYPGATEDFNRRINKGALIFNYTGHGGEVGLTSERFVDIDGVNSWNNFNHLTLFVTATCEFSRFDDPNRTSAGELCLLNPQGGAIALFTTCRLAFSNTNKILNSVLFNNMFKKLPNGKEPCLGDIVRQTKATLTEGIAYANFHLLGDPALKLAYPSLNVSTTKINGKPVVPAKQDSLSNYTTIRIDTLSALAKITISGSILNGRGLKQDNFNGIVYPTVFDKQQNVTCLLNDNASSMSSTTLIPFQFNLQKNILYRGKTQVTNGDFSFTFIVPKDISFSPGIGRISYYATNGLTDAAGSYSQVVVGGTSQNVIIDNDGPQVSLFLNDKNFVNGGTTNEKPILYANLTDSSGINTVGTGIGHDINVILDQNTSKPIILNDFYEANLNSYQSGKVRYPFDELSEGNHRLTFKVWDIQNNSNTVYSDFVVAKSAELALSHVLNYPNPFSSHTTFFFEHNQACNPLKVNVQIYTISGKIVKTLQRSISCEGFRPEGIDWDGKDDYGDKLARGVYIYKIAVLTNDNKKADKIEKLVILN
ncbi:MAG: type IX secretion system sortase PorU [Bacteroidota bacterium]|nr:type IX secretion system sortase PorU [Bacteroidota bacterium]